MRMEAGTEQFLFCFAVPSPHCLDGIQVRCSLYVPLDSFHWSSDSMHHPSLFAYDRKGTNKCDIFQIHFLKILCHVD